MDRFQPLIVASGVYLCLFVYWSILVSDWILDQTQTVPRSAAHAADPSRAILQKIQEYTEPIKGQIDEPEFM